MPHSRVTRLALAAALAAVALAYAPTLSSGYFRFHEGLVNDDDVQLLATLQRQVPYGLGVLLGAWAFRWTAILLFAGDLLLGGLHPVAFHAVSLGLHLGCVSLVFFLGLELRLAAASSAAAAALFGLAALHHETIRWLLGRFDLLASAFSLASALLLLRWTRAPERRGLYAASLVAAALAICSKESAVALGPLALWLCVFARRGTPRAGLVPALRAASPFLALAAAVLAFGVFALGFSNSASLAFGWAPLREAALEVFPRFLGGAYAPEGALGVSSFAGGALLAFAFLGPGDRRGALLALGGLGATLAVVHAAVASSALPNHFYLPGAWLALLLGCGVRRLADRGRAGAAVAALLALAIAVDNLRLLVL